MTRIFHREQGSGPTVILIHGFPFNHLIWDGFVKKLSEEFHVVTPDLPGFGRSPILPEGFSIDDVGSAMLSWMQEKQFHNPILVGHSLGGYVSLAIAEQKMDGVAGLCLFHSTALADSDEKRKSRDKVLTFIADNGVHAFTSNFIAQLYADPRHQSITTVKNLAVQASEESVVGYTKAMRDRKDRTSLFKEFPKPILFLAGEKDAGIPTDSILRQAKMSRNGEVAIIPAIAHMGMFEAEVSCLKKIKEFVKKCAVTFSN